MRVLCKLRRIYGLFLYIGCGFVHFDIYVCTYTYHNTYPLSYITIYYTADAECGVYNARIKSIINEWNIYSTAIWRPSRPYAESNIKIGKLLCNVFAPINTHIYACVSVYMCVCLFVIIMPSEMRPPPLTLIQI